MTVHDFEIDEQALREAFLAEAGGVLTSLEESALALEMHGARPHLMAELLREAHTLKGSASCAGFHEVADQAHVLEQLIEDIREGRITRGSTSLLLDSLDAMRRALPSNGDADVLPVALPKLDRLLDLTGEMAIARGRLKQALADPRVTREELIAIELESDRLHGELQDVAMKMRTIPVATLFRQSVRAVRDLSASMGKQVRLDIEAADVELDTSIVDHVRDALLHLVRNAVDHGIESSGTIRLAARQQGSAMILDVSDDGRGLDLAAIRRKAIALGLIESDAFLTDEETRELIFRNGFSTASAVSEVSGRGVGLDVVRKRIAALRGSIRVTDAHPGTRFTITMPMTLAILDGFHVMSGGETFVIPLMNVVECIAAPSEATGGFTMELRGEALPCVDLARLDIASCTSRRNIVVISDGQRRAGLVVDALQGASEIVIKPLPSLVPRSRHVASSTILPDGRVALLLDVDSILRAA